MRLVAEWFDTQGARFDERAGLPAGAGRNVASAVVDLAGRCTGPVLEIGAGTGEIGRHLAPLGHNYVGTDLSRSMLDAFRAKLEDAQHQPAALVQADADTTWPVRDHAVALVLASRVAHLLDGDHLASEVVRVCRPGGVFLAGRMSRDRDSVKSRLRQRRQEILRERGFTPRDAGGGARQLIDRFVSAGATVIGERTAAAWRTTASAEQVLGTWATLTAMGGVPLDPATRAAILGDLREWAANEIGDLERPEEFEERYVLSGVTLP